MLCSTLLFQIMAEIPLSVLWGFGQKIPKFRLEAHEGVEEFEGKKKYEPYENMVVFGKRGLVKLYLGVYET